jgi:hypothetical protein
VVLITQHYHYVSASHGGINKTHKAILKEYCFIPRSAVAAFIARCRKCVDSGYRC